MAESDAELLARLRDGDPRAFASLYDRHAPAVYRLARSLTQDRDDARDAVQEAFLVLWRRRRMLDGTIGQSALPWLLATCRNCCLNLRRSRRRRDDRHLSPEQWASLPASDSGSSDAVHLVLSEVLRLSEVDQEICRLCLVEGFTYEEAAARLGLSRAAVSKRTQRLRTRLRALRPEAGKEG